MTSTEMLSRVRGLLDEASAGFWTDAQLYQYLDSAQSIIISKLLDKQKQLKIIRGNDYEIETLKPLIKLSSAIATTTTPNISLSSITDLIEIYQVYLYDNTNKNELQLNYIPLHEFRRRKENSYTSHTYSKPDKTGQVYCSWYQGNIVTSFTAITTDTTYTTYVYDKAYVYYYAQPTAVASGQNYTLPTNTHEAGILLATALANYQNGKSQEGALFSQQAETLIQNL